jgi:hypothetical protein
VILNVGRLLPRSTAADFLRLLESKEDDLLKDLIRTFYEWIPDEELRYASSLVRSRHGEIHINRQIAGEHVDIVFRRDDSGGDQTTCVYLGSPHTDPVNRGGGLSFANYTRSARFLAASARQLSIRS